MIWHSVVIDFRADAQAVSDGDVVWVRHLELAYPLTLGMQVQIGECLFDITHVRANLTGRGLDARCHLPLDQLDAHAAQQLEMHGWVTHDQAPLAQALASAEP